MIDQLMHKSMKTHPNVRQNQIANAESSISIPGKMLEEEHFLRSGRCEDEY